MILQNKKNYAYFLIFKNINVYLNIYSDTFSKKNFKTFNKITINHLIQENISLSMQRLINLIIKT